MEKKRVFRCVICKHTMEGWGNNPQPLVFHGRCCDKCNQQYVIPFRIMLMNQIKKDGRVD